MEFLMALIPSGIFWCILIGVVIGGIVGLVAAKNKGGKAAKEDICSFDYLIRHQVIYDRSSGAMVTHWFQENKDKAKEPAFCLAKPTVQTCRMFMLTGLPVELDPETNLLQVVIDKEKMEPVAVRLLSFSEIPAALKEKFGSGDYFFVDP